MITGNTVVTAIVLGLGLAMDAFAVSLSNGISIPQLKTRHGVKTGLFFGFFQFIMPVIGWFTGIGFSGYVEAYAHWIGFTLLLFIGGKMIYETFSQTHEGNKEENPLDFKVLTALAIATSIDALLVGVGFAAGNMNMFTMFFSCTMIGIVAFFLSFAGVLLGKKTGDGLRGKAGLFGGIILIFIAIKILLEGLGIFHI